MVCTLNMPYHPQTPLQHLRVSICTPLSVCHPDNHRQRCRNPYGHPEDPSSTFDNPQSPSMTFDIPSIPFNPLQSPSRPFNPSSILLEGLHAYVEPSLRPRTIPQYLGHHPLYCQVSLAGFRSVFGSFVMLVADCVQYRLHWDAG